MDPVTDTGRGSGPGRGPTTGQATGEAHDVPHGAVAAPSASGEPRDDGPPWRRLAAGMLFVAPAREVLRFIPLLVVLLFAGRAGDSGPPWGLIGTVAVVVLGLARYLSTRFRITPTAVEIRSGLLTRHTSTVPRDRVRSVDVSAHPLHRMLKLVRVQIGTGSSGERHDESLVLDGLRAGEAAALRAELLHRGGRTVRTAAVVEDSRAQEAVAPQPSGAAPDAEIELARLDPRWIWFAPLTLSGVVTAAVLIGVIWRLLNEARINPASLDLVEDVVAYLRSTPIWVDVAWAAAIILVVVTVLSVIGYVLAFWNFRLTRHPGGSLHVSRGLLTTRAVSVDERRLRGVERSEPLLLRAARAARVSAITTGLRSRGGSDRSESLLPPGPLSVATRVERDVLRTPAPIDADLLPRPRVVRGRRYSRALVPTAVVALALAGWAAWGALPAPFAVLGVLALAPAAWLAEDRFRNLGHVLLPDWLVTRTGSLIRRRAVLARSGTIGVVLRRSYFQRRRDLTTVAVTTAAGRQRYSVPDLADDVAIDLARELLPLTAQFLRAPD